MMLMKWNDSYSVNVREIDQQHKRLFDLINKLLEAMQKKEAHSVLMDVLNGLTDYTIKHFQNEEKYFNQFNYPLTAEHIKEHQDFIKKVSEFNNNIKKDKNLLTIQVMNFLRDWLKNHIKGSDQKYSSFFKEKGLS